MQESDFMYANYAIFVLRNREHETYTVLRGEGSGNYADSAYPMTDEGLATAKKRCDQLANARKALCVKA